MFDFDPIFILLTILITAVLLLAPSVAWLLFSLKKQKDYYEGTTKKARAKAEAIVDEAKTKSQEALMEVDKNVSKYLSERKAEIDSVHVEFVAQLEALRKDARTALSEASKKVSLFSDDISESAGKEIGRSVKEANLAIENVVNVTKGKIDAELGKLSEKIPLIDENLQEIASLNKDAKRKLLEGSESFTKISKELSEEARRNLDVSTKEACDVIKGLAEDARGHMKDDTNMIMGELSSARDEISRHFRETLKVEMDEMKKEIERHKSDRLRVVDEHIVTLVEETASIALNTKLSRDDHRDVIHNALEEAKKRGAFERS